MNGYGWDMDTIESFDEFDEDWYAGEDEDSAEFVRPALGFAAGRALGRKMSSRRPAPTARARPYTPAVVSAKPVSQPMVAGAFKRVEEDVKRINAGIKTLEARLDSYSTQLVALQKRSDVEVSGEIFRSNLTSAGLGLGLAIQTKSFGLGAAHVLAALQTNFRAAGASVTKRPFATVGFPVGAGLLALFGDRLIEAVKGSGTSGGPVP